jgi:hypothetical protein
MTVEKYILKHWKTRTVKMLSEDMLITDSQVRAILRKHNIDPISEHDLKSRIVLTHCDTMTAEEIAQKFNLTLASISLICKEWGVNCVQPCKKPIQEPYRLPGNFWDRVRAATRQEAIKEYDTFKSFTEL